MSFEIGDEVTLNKNSRFNNGEHGNPLGVKEKVLSITNLYCVPRFQVEWDNGTINSYGKEDLLIVTKQNEKTEQNNSSQSNDLVDDIDNHKGHEIVDQYIMKNGEQEWFKYCRDCKVEVAEKNKTNKESSKLNINIEPMKFPCFFQIKQHKIDEALKEGLIKSKTYKTLITQELDHTLKDIDNDSCIEIKFNHNTDDFEAIKGKF